MSQNTTTNRRRHERQSWQATATVAAADQQRLQRLIQHETLLYNALNETLRSKLRSDATLLAGLSDREAAAFVAAVGERFQIGETRVRGFDKATLPAALEEYRTLLFNRGLDVMERRRHDSLMGLFEAASHPAMIHAEMRRRLARQVLEHYQAQARVAAAGATGTFGDEQMYRTPISLLESYDLTQKRHVQLHRPLVSLQYVPAKDQTVIKTPYTTQLMTVEGDIASKVNFTLMIVHQQPGRVPTAQTPWAIDFRKADEPYLLSYVESSRVNDGLAFAHMARMAKSAI